MSCEESNQELLQVFYHNAKQGSTSEPQLLSKNGFLKQSAHQFMWLQSGTFTLGEGTAEE